MRPLGDIIQDFEDIANEHYETGILSLELQARLKKLAKELAHEHEMQMGDILSLVYNYLRVHFPDCIEVYEDGSSPIFEYKAWEYLYRERDLLKRILEEYRVGRPRREWKDLMEEVEDVVGDRRYDS